jgi:hypothetical protein
MSGKGSSPRNLGPQFRDNYDNIFRTPTPMKPLPTPKTGDSTKWQKVAIRKQAKPPKYESIKNVYDDIETGYQHFIQKRMRLTKADTP